MRLALDGQRNTTQSTDIPVVVWMEHTWRSVCSNLSSRVTGSVHLPRPSGAIRPLCRPGWTWRRPWPTPRPGWAWYLPKWHRWSLPMLGQNCSTCRIWQRPSLSHNTRWCQCSTGSRSCAVSLRLASSTGARPRRTSSTRPAHCRWCEPTGCWQGTWMPP